jgi:co-chaperonin GroES (HSP10)
MDVSKIKPTGPWIVVKVLPPAEKTVGGIYRPQGNLEDQLGNSLGIVVSVGQGTPVADKVRKRTGRKYDPIDLDPGMVIAFRGYLQDANRVGEALDREHCLIHVNDVIGEVLEADHVV